MNFDHADNRVSLEPIGWELGRIDAVCGAGLQVVLSLRVLQGGEVFGGDLADNQPAAEHAHAKGRALGFGPDDQLERGGDLQILVRARSTSGAATTPATPS